MSEHYNSLRSRRNALSKCCDARVMKKYCEVTIKLVAASHNIDQTWLAAEMKKVFEARQNSMEVLHGN